LKVVCYSDWLQRKKEEEEKRVSFYYFFTIQHVWCIYKQQVYYWEGYYAYIQLIRERGRKKKVSRAISSQYGHRCSGVRILIYLSFSLSLLSWHWVNEHCRSIFTPCAHDNVVYLNIRKRKKMRKREREWSVWQKKKERKQTTAIWCWHAVDL
jgi:hypothetical protein